MKSYKVLWTNGKILDIENDKNYDWIMTKDDVILSMGDNQDKPEDYDK